MIVKVSGPSVRRSATGVNVSDAEDAIAGIVKVLGSVETPKSDRGVKPGPKA